MAKTFKDAAGREWTIALTLGSAMGVRDKLSVDLLRPEAGDPPLLTRLGTDELLLGEVICTLLEPQFEAAGISEQDVREAFDGKTILAAQTAFYEELIDFFQQRGRADRAAMVKKQTKLIGATSEVIRARVDAFDIEKTIRGAMSGSSPEASDSTPDP